MATQSSHQLDDQYGPQSLAKRAEEENEDPSNPLYEDMVSELEKDEVKRTPDTAFAGPSVPLGHARSSSANENGPSHSRETSTPISGHDLSILGSDSGVRRPRLAAERHITICPEDWRGGASKRVLGLLKRFIAGDQRALNRQDEVLQTLAFREDAMEFADIVIDKFNLQRPAGSRFCAGWPQYMSLDSAIKHHGVQLYQRYQWCRDKLQEKAATLSQQTDKDLTLRSRSLTLPQL